MFLTLLRKECMQHLKSIVYYIVLLYLVVDFTMQMGTFDTVEEPKPGMESYMEYGSVPAEDEELIMQLTLENLLYDYEMNQFVTYPIGFYKEVILSDAQLLELKDIILDVSGLSETELQQVYDQYHEANESAFENETEIIMQNDMPRIEAPIKAGYSYESFLQQMKKVDDMLGGGSDYSETSILHNSEQSPTYEQACEIYNNFIEKDKVTNAYARLFCDYEGITLAIISIFLAVARSLRDKKSQMEQVVYSHGISSMKIVLSRYLATVIMLVIPMLLFSCSTLMQAVYYAKRIHVEYDIFAFVKHIGFWLLPTILITLSVGFFLTELTDSPVAILVQGIWWFVSIYTPSELVGVVGWNLIPRFNSVVCYEVYEKMKPELFLNRGVYAIVAMVLLVCTIWIYDCKRKGVFVSVGAKLRNRKGQLEA